MTYISSVSMSSALRQSIQNIQADLSASQREISSGVKDNLGVALGAQTGIAISLTQQSDALNGYTSANALTSARLSTTSSALDSIIASAQSFSNSLISSAGSDIPAAVQTSARMSLQALTAALNTSAGGQYIFGGIDTQKPPVLDTATLQQDVDTAITAQFGSNLSGVSGSNMSSYLNGQFSTILPDNSWSSASDTPIVSEIMPAQRLATSVSANEPAFQHVAQAYTIIAQLGNKDLNADASQVAVSAALKLLNQGISELSDVQAGVGLAQNAVSAANSSMSAQMTLIANNVSDLEGVDPSALSSKITILNTQLQESYELTSQLQSLSLVKYLTN